MHPPLGWFSYGRSGIVADVRHSLRTEHPSRLRRKKWRSSPGNRDNIPIWLTIICGIGGVLIGWFIYTAFGGNGSPGIDWVRWITAIVVAAVLVMIASALTARSRSRTL